MIYVQSHLASQTQDNLSLHAELFIKVCKGTFFNYVDQILPIIDHLPTVDICEGVFKLAVRLWMREASKNQDWSCQKWS